MTQWMDQFQAVGMEELPCHLEACIGTGRAVDRVSKNGSAEMLQVDADLMGSAGQQFHLYQGEVPSPLQHGQSALSRFSLQWMHAHLLPVDGMTSNGSIDHPLSRSAHTESEVVFADLSGREEFHEFAMGLEVFGS